MKTTLLPAIRSHVGDWVYYVTTLSFEEVAYLIKNPDEIHERKKLSDWIQREAIEKHSEAIATYICENEQRFLGSLIVGVYDGRPDWSPLSVDYSKEDLDASEEQRANIDGKLGFLFLTGGEKLFAIDGQHRVAGIKRALQKEDVSEEIKKDSVSAIFVAHDESSDNGKQRTRRLFTTVNKKAKRISKAATIALDEDNGFAVVTRRLIDSHWLFEDKRQHISYSSSGAIPAQDKNAISSVVGLYEIIKDLYPKKLQKSFEEVRPTDEQLNAHLGICTNYFNLLLVKISPYKEVFSDGSKSASDYREGDNNHLLFRPVGQRAFAKAAELLTSSGNTLDEAVTILSKANMHLTNADWHHIVWDPIDNKMIATKLALAETQLLKLVDKPARDKKHASNLKKLLDSIAELKEG